MTILDDAIIATQRAKGQMVLGELIECLEQAKPNASVATDWGHLIPIGFCSYRGHYDHLALGFAIPAPLMTARKLLELSRFCLIDPGVHGYKGGRYKMTPQTPVWIANWGCVTDIMLTGVKREDYDVVLQTKLDRG